MNNYNDNLNQYNNLLNNQQPSFSDQNSNIYLDNNPSLNQPNTNLFNNSSNNVNQTFPLIEPNQLLLNGTNLDDEPINNSNYSKNKDSRLIKSVAREIINGLKENNMSLYDNKSINSQKIPLESISADMLDTTDNYTQSKRTKKLKKNSKNKNDLEIIENFFTDDKTQEKSNESSNSNYVKWFFDKCFNYKDFLILFIIYFVLSQDMIKDFFSRYFTSLNPDDEGKVGIQGVIIYGLILTILFMIIRRFF